MLLVCHVYFDPGEYILILGIEADPPNLEIIFLGPENPTVYRTSERSVVVIFFETQRWQVVMTNVATLRAAIVAIQCPEPLPPSRYLNLDPLCSRNLELRRSKPLEKPTKYYLNVERRLMKKLPMTSTLHVGRYGGGCHVLLVFSAPLHISPRTSSQQHHISYFHKKLYLAMVSYRSSLYVIQHLCAHSILEYSHPSHCQKHLSYFGSSCGCCCHQ